MAQLSIRGLDSACAARFSRAAQARGMTQSEYLSALVALHDAMRALADTPTANGRWEQVLTGLDALGLGTVTA